MASAQRGRKTADRVVSIDASPDAALLERVKGLKRGGARRAVHLHLSRLQQPNRRSEQLRIAGKPFESLFKAHDAELFSLTGGDIVFICKGARVAEIDDAVLQVRALFDKDPLTKGERQGRNSQFSTWYNLPKDYDAFLTAATALVEGPPPTQQPQGGAPAKAPKLKPIEPAMLAEIERVLANANLSKLMRRQLVCEISDDLPPQPVYRELYVSIADLQAKVTPNIDLVADRWLFQRLTYTLDRRVLSSITESHDDALNGHVSLNLNVASLLTPEFLNFDARLRAGARGTVVIEIPVVDLFSDMGAYMFARDLAQERGYSICLDGLTHLTAPMIDRETLGIDLLKVYWSNEMLDDPSGQRREAIRGLVERADPGRVIICRCDNARAIDYGRELGLSLFQGMSIDAMLSQPGSKQPDANTEPARHTTD